MTQPDEQAAALDRMVMDYPVELERLPDALAPEDSLADGEG